jgi:hypothetical protein
MENKHLRAARIFAKWMDGQYSFLGINFGFDNILGFFPGIGDFLSFLLSLYLVWIGVVMELPGKQIRKMITNVVLDAAIGSVPVLGDIGDLFFKANQKNLQILEEFA